MEVFIPTSNLHLAHRPNPDPFFFSPTTGKPATTLSFKKKPHLLFPNSLPKLKKAKAPTAVSCRASSFVESSTAVEVGTLSSASTRWMVVMKKPPNAENSSRADIVDYFVHTLARVLPSEREAQICIYRASWQMDFFFCCDIDEVSSQELARLPEVVSVRLDRDMAEVRKGYESSNLSAHQSNYGSVVSRFSPSAVDYVYWIVKMKRPGVEVVTKAQMVDYFAQTLTKVLGNEKDAQICIYNISWEKDCGFCCQIDEECARELSDVPGILSVQPDLNFESENKNYKVDDMSTELHDSQETTSLSDVKTKRLFVTGLSFYTSEKTLRAAFEPYGELVEVKIIMDKISKRSKGYAFIEYTTEEAAGAALKEMNGKIINGWMIVVDVAKTNPPKHNRGRPRPPSSSSSYTY